jgi:cell division protein ZapA
MPQISVTIDGKTYRMACDEGQEEHLSMLASRFDRYITHLRGAFGEIGDQRLTVMAGIMVVDELNEVQKRIQGLEAEIDTLRKTRDEALLTADRHDAETARKLAILAERMELVADKLGGNGAAPHGA